MKIQKTLDKISDFVLMVAAFAGSGSYLRDLTERGEFKDMIVAFLMFMVLFLLGISYIGDEE